MTNIPVGRSADYFLFCPGEGAKPVSPLSKHCIEGRYTCVLSLYRWHPGQPCLWGNLFFTTFHSYRCEYSAQLFNFFWWQHIFISWFYYIIFNTRQSIHFTFQNTIVYILKHKVFWLPHLLLCSICLSLKLRVVFLLFKIEQNM